MSKKLNYLVLSGILAASTVCIDNVIASSNNSGNNVVESEAMEIKKSTLFDEWLAEGELTQEFSYQGKDYDFTLWSQRGQYDITDFLIDLGTERTEKFLQEVEEILRESLDDSTKRLQGPITNYNIVLMNEQPAEGVSATLHGTNVICLNTQKWEERMSKDSQKAILYYSVAHEEFHLQNYSIKPGETKFTRELSAMLWEAATILRRENNLNVLWNLIAQNKHITKSREIDWNSDFYTKYDAGVTRGLAYMAASDIYRCHGVEGIEQTAKGILFSLETGVEGVDKVLKQEGLKWEDQPITVEGTMKKYFNYVKK